MKVIVGLGNIGKEYECTRHNVGFMTLDGIAATYNFDSFHREEKFEAELSQGEIGGEKVILVKPQTFMNASGRAVQKILNFYKVDIEDLIVIHDDLDIKLGDFRVAKSRNSAGHKGVQSIIDSLSSKDFNRIRVGIQIENRKIPTENYVLGNFTKEEIAVIKNIIDTLPKAIEKELF
ncbi:MAG: aminoacyl-tRNA hydrolase [Candidatus Pacebacteria bacterium]|nr:aminoacyl-tRNA hydrolase [Candidatus Paceibacterota bacterium]